MSLSKLILDETKPWLQARVSTLIVDKDLIINGSSFGSGYYGAFYGKGDQGQSPFVLDVYQPIIATSLNLSQSSDNFDVYDLTTNPRIEYTGTPDITVNVLANYEIFPGGGDYIVGSVAVFKNGVIVPRSVNYYEYQGFFQGYDVYKNITLFAASLPMSTGDILELYNVVNTGSFSTTNTIRNLKMQVVAN